LESYRSLKKLEAVQRKLKRGCSADELRVKKRGGGTILGGPRGAGGGRMPPRMTSTRKGFNIWSSFCSQLVYSGLALLLCMQDEERERESG